MRRWLSGRPRRSSSARARSRRSSSSSSPRIGVELWRQSRLSIEKFGFELLDRRRSGIRSSGEFGALPFIWGTLYSSVLALAARDADRARHRDLLSELCPARLRTPLAFLTELLAAIPSIVYGLWGIFVLVPVVRRLAEVVARLRCARLPLFSGPPLGVGMLSAVLILAIMIIPFTSSVAREVLKAVPIAQREAAYALGRDALGGDPGRALLRADRHHRRRSCSASAARSARRWP